jgi:hypothetical protein
VKDKPKADPRRALTIKNLRTLEKEQRAQIPSTPERADGSMTPAVQPASTPSTAKRTGGVAVALIAGVLLVLVIVLMTSSKQPPPEPTMGKVDLAAPPVAQPPTEPPPPTTPGQVMRSASPGVALKVVTPTAPTSTPAAKPTAATSAKPEPVATETPAAKPIFNEDGTQPIPKTPPKPTAAPKPLFE